MSRICSQDTKPELFVRRLIHGLGYRYRLHDHRLPGTPDLVFKSRKKVIFVHGCFWHRHQCRKGRSVPATRTKFWLAKFEKNRKRDYAVRRSLRNQNWKVLVIWECQLRPKNVEKLSERVIEFLEE